MFQIGRNFISIKCYWPNEKPPFSSLWFSNFICWNRSSAYKSRGLGLNQKGIESQNQILEKTNCTPSIVDL
jgi:hypothetical protein